MTRSVSLPCSPRADPLSGLLYILRDILIHPRLGLQGDASISCPSPLMPYRPTCLARQCAVTNCKAALMHCGSCTFPTPSDLSSLPAPLLCAELAGLSAPELLTGCMGPLGPFLHAAIHPRASSAFLPWNR